MTKVRVAGMAKSEGCGKDKGRGAGKTKGGVRERQRVACHPRSFSLSSSPFSLSPSRKRGARGRFLAARAFLGRRFMDPGSASGKTKRGLQEWPKVRGAGLSPSLFSLSSSRMRGSIKTQRSSSFTNCKIKEGKSPSF